VIEIADNLIKFDSIKLTSEPAGLRLKNAIMRSHKTAKPKGGREHQD
jgi:hypothetical protein